METFYTDGITIITLITIILGCLCTTKANAHRFQFAFVSATSLDYLDCVCKSRGRISQVSFVAFDLLSCLALEG